MLTFSRFRLPRQLLTFIQSEKTNKPTTTENKQMQLSHISGPCNTAVAHPSVDILQHALPDPRERTEGKGHRQQFKAGPFYPLSSGYNTQTLLCWHHLSPSPAESSHPHLPYPPHPGHPPASTGFLRRASTAANRGFFSRPASSNSIIPKHTNQTKKLLVWIKKNNKTKCHHKAALIPSLKREALQLTGSTPASPHRAGDRAADRPWSTTAAR